MQRHTIYRLKNVSKSFRLENGTTEALRDISFDILNGELTVVVGPSGCGKSTLLRLLAQLIQPTKGMIVGGNNSACGFVFQEPTLMPWRSVIDNVTLPLEVRGTDKQEAYVKARNLLDILDIGEYEGFLPAQLSGGMKQKAAIARALIHDPKVLLLDEPFSALDEMMRQKLNFELLQLKKETGITIVFVTHNVLEAVTLADRVIVMGSKPNTIIGETRIKLKKRSQKMLSSPAFFKEVGRVRRMMGVQA